jgi:uncharacterized membrane-anchored protein
MAALSNHTLRYSLSNELHARPFPTVSFPCSVAYLTIKPEADIAERNRDADRAHLIALLDRYGAAHPQPDATHYFGEIGKYYLRWESHTEFFTYTLIASDTDREQWDTTLFEVYPDDWLAEAPGSLKTSALVRTEPMPSDAEVLKKVGDWFVPESLAVSRVLDDKMIAASDFRIDHSGHLRFAIFVRPEVVNERRIGRVVQQLCEIETYKSMSMLGFAKARMLSQRISHIDQRFSAITSDIHTSVADSDSVLHALLEVSADLESTIAQSSFRFEATRAYESIVYQRINYLREDQFGSVPTIGEFMSRRFDPAMRTVKSTQERLLRMAERAQRAADLLRTRVDVQRSAQNQSLLESMNQRADLQLRLQRTVEGLSVVAISYYAVNLVVFVLAPFLTTEQVDSPLIKALATPVVVGAVWLFMRRVRQQIH